MPDNEGFVIRATCVHYTGDWATQSVESIPIRNGLRSEVVNHIRSNLSREGGIIEFSTVAGETFIPANKILGIDLVDLSYNEAAQEEANVKKYTGKL